MKETHFWLRCSQQFCVVSSLGYLLKGLAYPQLRISAESDLSQGSPSLDLPLVDSTAELAKIVHEAQPLPGKGGQPVCTEACILFLCVQLDSFVGILCQCCPCFIIPVASVLYYFSAKVSFFVHNCVTLSALGAQSLKVQLLSLPSLNLCCL